MSKAMLLLQIIIPVIFAILILVIPKRNKLGKELVAFVGVLTNLVIAIVLFGDKIKFSADWIGFGIDFSLKLYHFNSFILLAVAGFAFLIVMYATVFMKNHEKGKMFYIYLLLTVTLINGAVLADNLLVLLFFWEGLLVALFGMILTGNKEAYKTGVKALIISGAADLLLMLGIGMTVYLSKGEYTIDKINISMDFMGGFAFILLMIGAIAKAGSVPFHTWIPDAAVDTPLPFMAFLPAALEKLLGIYLLARISLDMFELKSGSAISIIMMTIGIITILVTVMMMLIQNDYKKMLAYSAISQVGYMILGIGTAIPVGIVGGLFHMINHAMYKSCLFLTAGSVEKQAGTTDLKKLGGIGKLMPVTFTCFLAAAAATCGVPPFNGFFSKELIFDGALESGVVFYIAALLGVFFTAVAFLKLGHAIYLGKQAKGLKNVKEAPLLMLIPMSVMAFGCLLFGVYNPLPLKHLIEPILGKRLDHTHSGLPHNWILVGISIAVLILAFLNHRYGVKKTKSAVGASDHIRKAPVLSSIYKWAEKGYFDPYNIGLKIVYACAKVLYLVDRGIDWLYNVFIVKTVEGFSAVIRKSHTGNQTLYIVWSLLGIGLIGILVFVLK